MMAHPDAPQAWDLKGLLEGLAWSGSGGDQRIDGLALDSRAIKPGDLFLACAGTQGHGLDHLSQAAAQGAVAVAAEPAGPWPAERLETVARSLRVPLVVVWDLSRQVSALAGRFFGDPSHRLAVVGVTGTNGKTSCTQFLAQALEPEERCGILGTLGTGFPGQLRAGRHTTPDPVELQAVLADLLTRGARSVAMEVSSHALDQRRAAAVVFETAVLTNLSRDHLDYHGTMERYGAAKLRLFRFPGLRRAVVNVDDPFGRVVSDVLDPGVDTLLYGVGRRTAPTGHAGKSFAWAERVTPTLAGLELDLHTSWGDARLKAPVLGRFNASNLLAVLGVLLQRGLTLEAGVERLARVRPVPGRMEVIGAEPGPLAVVDYAHTPDALEKVLSALREHCPGRLACVFGCGGERDRGKRPEMGAVAERLADRVILTDDNPRGEDGARIIADILGGFSAPQEPLVERQRAAAIRAAVAGARAGDLVAVCGKGHEDYQLVGDLRLPFSDSEQVRRALEEASGSCG
jgi:UDP-N-acetylmuramoyl-L-alanyl-D-glutamate--2,6-diaminopimelate ligase